MEKFTIVWLTRGLSLQGANRNSEKMPQNATSDSEIRFDRNSVNRFDDKIALQFQIRHFLSECQCALIQNVLEISISPFN